MKKMLTFFQFLVLSFFINCATAAAAPVPVDMTSDLWSFETTGYDGTYIDFETQSAASDDWIITGYIEWFTAPSYLGREKFSGILYADRRIEFSGFESSNTSLVALVDYFGYLDVSNNQIINGTGFLASDLFPLTIATPDWSATRMTVSTVPLPSTVWLFSTVLLGMIGWSKIRKKL